MSLDTVVEDITEQAHARAEEIREEAEAQATEIVESANDDAERILEEAEEEAERQIEREREQRLSSAKLEAKQERLEARRDTLEMVRERAEDAIAELSGDRREELTRALLEASSAQFDESDTVRVYGRADDEELLESILEAYDGYEYAGEHDCLGGVVVESDASRVRVNNTFDSVLEDVWEDNLKAINSRLFDDTQ